MKKFALFLVIFVAAGLLNAASHIYGGLSYSQRGILEIDGNQMPVSVFVRSFEDKTAMQMESPMGMLCRIEVNAKGEPTLIESSPIFPEAWARKYVLRDFLVIIGQRPPLFSASKKYSIKFSEFKELSKGGRQIPMEIAIKDADYLISLTTIKIKE